MKADHFEALNYLTAPANVCWRWADQGTVLVWSDGSTIAFREEIAAVLQQLAPGKLPPFPAVALLLAACRGKLPELVDIIGKSKLAAEAKDSLLKVTRHQLAVQVEAMLTELQKVTQLPTELITGLEAKALLAEIVFETARVERQIDPEPILSGLNGPFHDHVLNVNQTGVVGWSVDQVAHLMIVARGLKAQTAETLRLRMQTGLEALPGPADLRLTPSEQARKLLDQFSRDDELAGLARVARELMAAVRLPRRLNPTDESATSGVADIANRGPLDRLLLSELAHDDLTLATRVALNEALYLRREPPSRQPPATLAVLLDSGVRLWGVPRLFAVAVALALIAREKHHRSVSVWRVCGREVVPVDLLTRKGLIAHLGELETGINPAEALAAFNAKDEGVPTSSALDALEDSVLVTHRDTLADPDFRRLLALSPRPPGFVATVDREGTFQLHALPLAHRPPSCEAKLDLQPLFAERPLATPLLDPALAPGLPLIFGVRPFPLLLPVTGKIETIGSGKTGTVVVTRDRRILIIQGKNEGALQLAGGIPRGKTIWLRSDTDGQVTLLRMENRQIHFLRGNPAGQWQITSFPVVEPPNLVFDEGEVLLLIGRARTEVRSRHTGELVDTVENPPGPGFFGRLCTSGKLWYCAVWDGDGPAWEPITLPQGIAFDDVLLLFFREGSEGPQALTRMGAVYDAEGNRIFNAAREILWGRPSQDGHRILVNGAQKGGSQIFDLENKRIYQVGDDAELILNPRAVLPFRQLRWRFRAVHAREPGVFTLYSPKGSGLVIGPNYVGALEIRPKEQSLARPAESLLFREMPVPAELGCRLQVARWPNGSQAFLDSRGLLHLKSYDPTVAEVSVVLHEGEASGWCSDGLISGSNFFCPGRKSQPVELARRVAAFFARLC